MKQLLLTKGKVALVDDDDYEYLNQWKWSAIAVSKNKKGEPYWYACRVQTKNKVRTFLMLHRFIMQVTDKRLLVDHHDFDTLNNQKANLRVCTRSQNCSSFRKLEGTKSPYIGVSWLEDNQKWMAKIRKNYKQHYLGSFNDPVEAAKAYNKSAIEFHGEFATLNPVS